MTFVSLKRMIMSINPFSVSNLCLLLISAGLIAYFFYLWQVIKQRAATTDFSKLKKPVVRFLLLYTIYFTGLSLLAANHFFDVVTMPPRFLVVFVPLVFIVILLCRTKMEGALRFLQLLPPVLLIGVHVYRLLIELVFIQYANEKIIPAELSIHGRNLDLWIGVLALPVAFLFFKKYRIARRAGIFFNILGLLSLVNIFTIAVPSMPSPFRVYDTLYLPTYFPGILIVFLASFAIILHILSIRQLMALQDADVAKKPAEKKPAKTLLPL